MDFILLKEYLTQNLSQERLNHLYSTAKETQFLLERYLPECPSNEGYLAGLWHDAAREWVPSELLSYSLNKGIVAEEIELKNPHLLHGAVAAHLLKEMGSVEERVLRAIRWHTLGSVEMGALGAALYVADYIEPNRKFINPSDRLALLESATLEGLCLKVVGIHQAYFERRGRPMAPTTIELAHYLEEGGSLLYA
ncbi:MAG: bis(5'-nucleosyl)-tetraphosphatase (symmetrical) YqeK [Sphaerochaetaceae bacterium]|jgi:predicted HD superfamily hydrolase involved in NAD metabolism|nr:bis(5'-nucleosyl)-tetraphosphatase (symmetrical) YqeK [Sphaerochaetaceae bacterium]HHU88788.1 HD domain-containing protein [Spirochaetales bacterium]